MFDELLHAKLHSFHINQRHWHEWVVGSQIDPALTALNLRSLGGSTAYDYLLYADPLSRRNDGRLSQGILTSYRHLETGGWWCSSVDVLSPTLEASLWGCFKPNTPRLSTDKGKVIKYEHPPKVPTEIFALSVPDPIWDKIATRHGIKRYHSPLALRLQDRHQSVSFWEWVLDTPELPLLVTEGAKKAGSLLSAGYASVALPGVYNGYRQPKDRLGHKIGKPHLIPQLGAFAEAGREVVLVFDCDNKPKTIANVRKAILKTGKLLQQQGCQVSVITWSYPEKGVDDLIAARGAECFSALYDARIELEEFERLELLDLSPYVNLRVNQRYLRGDEETPESPPVPQSLSLNSPPSQAQLIALKSAKGTGRVVDSSGRTGNQQRPARPGGVAPRTISHCHRQPLRH